jgi:hypothetical protein
MSVEQERGTGRVTLAERERPVGSMIRLLLTVGVVWAVGRQVVPFFRVNPPLFMTEPVVIGVLCIGLLWWAFRHWRSGKRPATVAGGVRFLMLATCLAAALWFLTESYLIFEVYGFSSGAVLAAAVVLVLIWYVGAFVARSYWDTKVRLAVLEEIVRRQGVDPEQLRRDVFARLDRKSDPSLGSRFVRGVAGGDLAR